MFLCALHFLSTRNDIERREQIYVQLGARILPVQLVYFGLEPTVSGSLSLVVLVAKYDLC